MHQFLRLPILSSWAAFSYQLRSASAARSPRHQRRRVCAGRPPVAAGRRPSRVASVPFFSVSKFWGEGAGPKMLAAELPEHHRLRRKAPFADLKEATGLLTAKFQLPLAPAISFTLLFSYCYRPLFFTRHLMRTLHR